VFLIINPTMVTIFVGLSVTGLIIISTIGLVTLLKVEKLYVL